MNVADPDAAVPRIAAAIGEPARARMLYCLMDGRARTSTELAVVGGVSPSTASVHLSRLKTARLVTVLVQGKHRYYSLNGESVGRALEALNVLAGRPRSAFAPRTPIRLRAARTCYDHMAGTVAVALHDRLEGAQVGGRRVRRTPTTTGCPITGRRPWRNWGSISIARDRYAAASRSPASTGASAGLISVARSARPC